MQEEPARSNALARKSKAEGLTDAEKAEQATLRRESFRASRESAPGRLSRGQQRKPYRTQKETKEHSAIQQIRSTSPIHRSDFSILPAVP